MKVRLNLDVFERMLASSRFEFERPMTGMELELNLVDEQFQPRFANLEVLAAIADSDFQTELAQYNIEMNVSPRPLPGDSALELEEDLRRSLNNAETKAHQAHARIEMRIRRARKHLHPVPPPQQRPAWGAQGHPPPPPPKGGAGGHHAEAQRPPRLHGPPPPFYTTDPADRRHTVERRGRRCL